MRFPASNFLCVLLTVSAGCSQQSVNPVLEDTISFSGLPVNKHTLDYWRTFKKDTLTHEIKEIISMCMWVTLLLSWTSWRWWNYFLALQAIAGKMKTQVSFCVFGSSLENDHCGLLAVRVILRIRVFTIVNGGYFMTLGKKIFFDVQGLLELWFLSGVLLASMSILSIL